MQRDDWPGVFPAITTPFKTDLSVNSDALERHVSWLVDAGCKGIITLGSLGEGSTLRLNEKIEVVMACKRAIRRRVPLVAGVAGLSTVDAVDLAKAALEVGCDGLMVLPPLVYKGDWRETEAHLSAVIEATPISCMLYNNPIAYGTDVIPERIADLVRHSNFHAVKESSGDIRRVTAIRELLDDHLAIFVGLDDVVVESVAAGAVGWVAGLVNALPEETVELFNLAIASRFAELRPLYEWFLPLLRLDTLPKFVQLIKLVQAEVGRGTTTVRPPRLELEGAELTQAARLIRLQLAKRPARPTATG